jgi:hypothetical protein
MRRLAISAVFALSASILTAQHGGGGHAGGVGGHASFGGGGGSVARGIAPSQGFSHAAPRFTSPAHTSFPQSSHYQPGTANQTGNWTSAGFFPSHSGQVLPRNGRRNGRVGYGAYGYGYPLIGYPAFGYDDGFDTGSSDQNFQGNAAAGDAAAGYGYQDGPPQGSGEGYSGPAEPPYGYGPPDGARPAYNPGAEAYTGQGQGSGSNGLQHPPVILVFKDGHRMQAQNYAVTQTRVLVTDNSTERDIPISALDAGATAAANNAAGVEFSLPGAQ